MTFLQNSVLPEFLIKVLQQMGQCIMCEPVTRENLVFLGGIVLASRLTCDDCIVSLLWVNCLADEEFQVSSDCPFSHLSSKRASQEKDSESYLLEVLQRSSSSFSSVQPSTSMSYLHTVLLSLCYGMHLLSGKLEISHNVYR